MNRGLLIAMAVLLVFIGPVMFVFSRMRALDSALARIHSGETPAEVVAVLGKPQQQVRPARPAKVDLEYRYRVWPLAEEWVVDFNGGRVVRTVKR